MDTLIDYTEYWDMTLSNDDDYDKSIISSNEIIKEDLILWLDTNDSRCFTGFNDNNLTSLLSLSAWTGANITNNFTIYDVGLTGVDNGRYQELSGNVLNINTADTRIQLFQITGKTGSTSYDITSATTSNGNLYLSTSGGGYFQSFVKLAGYDQYNVFPIRQELGYTISTWIKYSGISNNTNSNFFLYLGTRSENKYYNIFSGETGQTTSSSGTSVDLSPSVSADTEINDVVLNSLGFRISGDSIGYRLVSGRTDCSGTTSATTIIESYSKHGIFDNFSGSSDSTDWINITIKWRRNKFIDQCTIDSGTTRFDGTLTFYLNARPVYEVKNFKEIIFRSIDTHKTKSQMVSFNLSWGGGSQGLKESQTTSGPDSDDSSLIVEDNFDGNLSGGISQLRFWATPLSVDKIIHNFKLEQSRYSRTENFGGRIINIGTGISA
ncbi:hypothetical protein COB55_03950 [Candidatus Wolfebacteria bacterium]|nr:MAG: hypothetical protein COB55_03950 [Candidatus Wolfebacteria bacterium]